MILQKLNDGDGDRVTIKDLAIEFKVSERTIYTDLNKRLSFLPLEREGESFFIEGFHLNKLTLKDIKNFSNFIGAEDMFPNIDENFLRELLEKKYRDIFIIKNYEDENISNRMREFELLKKSILERKRVSFNYKNLSRIVEPYKLMNQKGIWYLIGIQDGKLKNFIFSEIDELQTLDKKFTAVEEILENIRENKSIWFNNEYSEVILKVDSKVAKYFKRRSILPNQLILREVEDGLIILTKVAYQKQIFPIVKSWIPDVKIISPESWQYDLEEIVKKYLRV
jgi:predicted DNA-binding transcriptional regulator YafY